MVTSTVEIKKRIISSIFDFARNIDNYKEDEDISKTQIAEMINLSLSINKFIKALKTKLDDETIKPRISDNEYPKLKRVLDLAFKYKADLNAISMDIGEGLPQTNRLLQAGVDYILDNVKIGDYHKKSSETKMPDKDINSETITPKSAKPKQAATPRKTKKSSGIGFFPSIIFLALVVWGGYSLYNTFFNNHATNVSSLVHEYRSDSKLSSIARSDFEKSLKIYGSSSLLKVINSWKDKFTVKYPDINIVTKSTDTSIAISALLDGEASLAAVSRIPSIEERKKSQKLNRLISDHKVAMDAVAVFVHPSSKLDTVSVEDLRDIFSHKSNHLQKFSNTSESGTYHFFKERVLFTEKMADDVIMIFDSSQIVDMVSKTPNSIGYTSVAHIKGKNVKVLKISTLFDERGVLPLKSSGLINTNAIKRGEYPLTRYLYLVTAGEITDAQAKLIDYFRSEESQSLLGKNGLVGIF